MRSSSGRKSIYPTPIKQSPTVLPFLHPIETPRQDGHTRREFLFTPPHPLSLQAQKGERGEDGRRKRDIELLLRSALNFIRRSVGHVVGYEYVMIQPDIQSVSAVLEMTP